MKQFLFSALALFFVVAATPATAAGMEEIYSLGTSAFPNIVLTYATTSADETTVEAISQSGFKSGLGVEFLFNEHFGIRGMTHYVYDYAGNADAQERYTASLVYHF